MSRIRRTDTSPELIIRRLSFARGLRYRKYATFLPGSPDLVFRKSKVVVFIDGDFWHGWGFDDWEHKLPSDYWKVKIRRNKERDQRNKVLLEKDGWIVVRIWEHEVKSAADSCVDRIETVVKSRLQEKACREYRLTDGAAAPGPAAG